MGNISDKLESVFIVTALCAIGILGGFALIGLAKIGVEAISDGVKTVKKGARYFIKVKPLSKEE